MQILHVYIKCTHCGKWHDHANIISYTSFSGSGENWSDGKTVTPYDHEFASFIKCGNCQRLFWEKEATTIEEHNVRKFLNARVNNHKIENEFTHKQLEAIKDFMQNEETEDLPDTSYPLSEYFFDDFPEVFIIEDLENTLSDSTTLSLPKEVELRVYLWHTINDFVRFDGYFKWNRLFDSSYLKDLLNINDVKNQIAYRKKSLQKFIEHNDLRIKNLERLLDILKPVKTVKDNIIQFDSYDIQKIELNRELGRFKEAMNLIDNLNPSDSKFYYRFLRKSVRNIKKQNTYIFRIK